MTDHSLIPNKISIIIGITLKIGSFLFSVLRITIGIIFTTYWFGQLLNSLWQVKVSEEVS